MRKIEIVDDVRVRFPGLGQEFDLGLELGAISVLMAQGLPIIDRQVSANAVDLLRPLAEKFRYTLVATPATTPDVLEVSLVHHTRRPQLRLVR